ncbi:MAG: SufD family Fe-S cluster assembly protein [Cytophagales bacterium]|nr:SufD family Fe-S cluster assembly protein [Cytophagales bacterium]
MSTSSRLARTLKSVQERKGSFSEAWTKLRKHALDQLIHHGLPSFRDEDYKYTPLHGRWEQIDPSVKAVSSVDGSSSGSFSWAIPLGLRPQEGISVDFWKGSPPQDPRWDIDFLAEYVSDPFACLNILLAEEGYFLDVEGGQRLGDPILLPSFRECGRSSIRVGAGAQVILIQAEQGQAKGFQNDFQEIICGKGSRVLYYQVQEEGSERTRVNNVFVELADRAYFQACTFSFSRGMTRNNLHVRLKNPGAEAHLHGLYLPVQKSLIDYHTHVHHLSGQTESHQLYKGILRDQAQGVFRGRIQILPHAQKTYAYQRNQTILCDPRAVMHAQPQLEIEADDVKCSHGCTTGYLDKAALFYLQARGISLPVAQQLIFSSFLRELLDIEDLRLKEYLEEKMLKTLLPSGYDS